MSDFTDIWRLEQQEIGGNRGAWGRVFNDNLRHAEHAIDGFLDLNLSGTSGDTELSVGSNVPDEARYRTIRFHGSLSDDADVIVPEVTKFYMFHNDTTGGTLRVKTPSGEPFELRAGYTSPVYCDADDIILVAPLTTPSGTVRIPRDLSVSGDAEIKGEGGIPAGMAIMWSGSVGTIPSGWILCDGSGDSPDLTDRFVVGSGDTYSLEETGGSLLATTSTDGSHDHSTTSNGSHDHGGTNNHTLSTSQIPSHNHTTSEEFFDEGASNENINANENLFGTFEEANTDSTGGSNSHSHGISNDGSHTHSINSTGSHSHTGPTLSPYYALCYILRT
jgi:hypothetical protein